MAICHQEPHLVLPMRLTLHNDKPLGGINQPPMAPKWISRGKSFASKTTDRAIKSIRAVSTGKPTKRVSISAPSNFVHVNAQTPRQTGRFRPLELSIHLPGNELPELPEFNRFDPDDTSWLTPPPKTLSSPFSQVFDRYTDVSAYTIPRKPLSSTAYRTLFRGSVKGHLRRTTLPEPLALHPVIESPESGFSNNRGRRQSETVLGHPTSTADSHDGPLSGRPQQTEGIHLVLPPPPPRQTSTEKISYIDATDENSARVPIFDVPSSQSHRVARWLLQSSSPSSSSQSPIHSNFRTNPFQHSRSRTHSGSTLSGRTPSLTSAGTASTVYPPPPLLILPNKELDFPNFPTPCPTVYEGKGRLEPCRREVAGRHHRRLNSGDIGVAI